MAAFNGKGTEHVTGCETPSCDILNDVQTVFQRAKEDIDRLLLRMTSHNPDQLTCSFHKKEKCEKTRLKIKFDHVINLMERLKQESLKHFEEHELTLTGQIRGHRGRDNARQNVKDNQDQYVAMADSGISSITSQELERAMANKSNDVDVTELDNTFQTALKTVRKILSNADTGDADTGDADTGDADTGDADTGDGTKEDVQEKE